MGDQHQEGKATDGATKGDPNGVATRRGRSRNRVVLETKGRRSNKKSDG